MKIEIKSWISGRVLFEGDFSCISEAVTAAVTRLIPLRGADLTRADLTGAVLTGAVLKRADLTGAVLTRAVLTGADLKRADLTRAVLTRAVLKRADLTGAVLTGADLTRAVLTGAVLTGADLTRAVLTGADLKRADLTGIFKALPDLQNPDAKIVEILAKGEGSLRMDSWHECATTHCRAGWYIHQSGDAGRMLEAVYGPATAGALIFAKAYPGRKIPNFYASNEAALCDIKSNAEK